MGHRMAERASRSSLASRRVPLWVAIDKVELALSHPKAKQMGRCIVGRKTLRVLLDAAIKVATKGRDR